MTAKTHSLTYAGRLAAASICLPARTVQVTRGGDPVPFSSDELEHLDAADWIELDEPAQLVESPGTGEPMTGHEVPVGKTSTMIDDGTGPALVLIEGERIGTIDEVVALATTPERAAALLDHERAAKKPRSGLVAQLAALAGDPTTADTATTEGA